MIYDLKFVSTLSFLFILCSPGSAEQYKVNEIYNEMKNRRIAISTGMNVCTGDSFAANKIVKRFRELGGADNAPDQFAFSLQKVIGRDEAFEKCTYRIGRIGANGIEITHLLVNARNMQACYAPNATSWCLVPGLFRADDTIIIEPESQLPTPAIF